MLDTDLNEVSRRMSNFNKNIQQKIKLAWSDVLLRITAPELLEKQAKETPAQIIETSINSNQMMFDYPKIEVTTTEPVISNSSLFNQKTRVTTKKTRKNRRQKLGTYSPGYTNAREKHNFNFLYTAVSIPNDKNQNQLFEFFQENVSNPTMYRYFNNFEENSKRMKSNYSQIVASHVEPSPTLLSNQSRNVNILNGTTSMSPTKSEE